MKRYTRSGLPWANGQMVRYIDVKALESESASLRAEVERLRGYVTVSDKYAPVVVEQAKRLDAANALLAEWRRKVPPLGYLKDISERTGAHLDAHKGTVPSDRT